MSSHLQLLANVALKDDDSTACSYDPLPTRPEDFQLRKTRMLLRSSHSRCNGRKVSSTKAKGLVRSRAIARDDKTSREQRVRMIIEQAHKIKSVGNSPVNAAQLRLLQSVFYKITKFPPDFWIALLAIITRRRFSQVKCWFSNQRQYVRSCQVKRNLPQDPIVTFTTQQGDTLKLRKEALELCGGKLEWSDDLFEGTVRLHYIRQ